MRKLFLLALISSISFQAFAQSGNSFLDEQHRRNVERAQYWATRGYHFDPERMTAFLMDQKVRDYERAAYWSERGYDFNPERTTAFLMDQKVRDYERADYWRLRGYDFDPERTTAFLMDQKVRDIERAQELATEGYDFDPNRTTAFLMDQKVKDIERAEYWRQRGYFFNPDQTTSFLMDQKVKDIERASYWAERGYNFNPDTTTAFMMDYMVSQGSVNRLMNLEEFRQELPRISYQQPASFRNTTQYTRANTVTYRGIQIVKYSNGRNERYLLNNDSKQSFENYSDAIVYVNASIARRDYGLSNEVVDSFLSADTDRNGELSFSEARRYLTLFYGNGVKRYLTNGRALNPNEFWIAGGGDCEDWSIYIAAFFYTWNYQVYIGLLESEEKGSAHAITLLYSTTLVTSFSSYSLESTMINPHGESIPPGYFIPVDYDEVGGLSNATDDTYELSSIFTPHDIIGRAW